jgi:hypothetical protein
MKIALCLSGQARCFEKTFDFINKNILQKYDVSVFYHAWDFPGLVKLAALYNPNAAMVEKPIQPDLSKYTRVPPPQPNWKVKDPALSTYAQSYSLMKANELKKIYEEENDFRFDWVIRTRFDFALNVEIPFEQLDNNKLYIPNCRMTPARDFGNDQFAFSSSENMDKYANVFNRIDEFYDSGVIMVGEEMMSANWKCEGLVGDNLVYINVNHPFPPGPHNGTWHSLVRDDFENWQKE